jgi:hypothetical protein
MHRVEVTGNTYANTELIKRLGGRWDANAKVWWFDSNSYSGRQWQSISSEIHRAGLRFVNRSAR